MSHAEKCHCYLVSHAVKCPCSPIKQASALSTPLVRISSITEAGVLFPQKIHSSPKRSPNPQTHTSSPQLVQRSHRTRLVTPVPCIQALIPSKPRTMTSATPCKLGRQRSPCTSMPRATKVTVLMFSLNICLVATVNRDCVCVSQLVYDVATTNQWPSVTFLHTKDEGMYVCVVSKCPPLALIPNVIMGSVHAKGS